jgi:glycosyltransferase involved in cell wall biosynthesis
MTITVIIPTHSRPQQLEACLEGLARQSCKDFSVIVVDDAGKIPAAKPVEQFQGKLDIRVIRNVKNSGAAFSRNFGIQNSANGFLCFLDDDAVPADDWVFEGYSYLNSHPEITCIVGRIQAKRPEKLLSKSRQRIYDQRDLYYTDPGVQQKLRQSFGFRHSESCLAADYLSGGNCWFQADVFSDEIRFPESVMWGHDKVLAKQIMAKGKLIAYDPKLIIYHDHEYRYFATMIKSFQHAYFSELGSQSNSPKVSFTEIMAPAFLQLLGKYTDMIPSSNCEEPLPGRAILASLTACYCLGTYLARKKKFSKCNQ